MGPQTKLLSRCSKLGVTVADTVVTKRLVIATKKTELVNFIVDCLGESRVIYDLMVLLELIKGETLGVFTYLGLLW